LSPIIDAGGCEPFDVSGIEGERDCLRRGERFALDENAEQYISSLVSTDTTGFDGAVTRRSFLPGTLSATTLRSYAQCPLRYLFEHQYGCEAISAERDEEALEASDIGTMFHSIAERFANAVKRGDIVLPGTLDDSVKKAIETIAKSVFDAYMKKNFTDLGRPITLVHRIAYNDLLKGLYEEHHQKGLLIRFLEYIYDEGSLEHFHKSEQFFMLDSDFKTTNDNSNAFVKGFIDRIDKDDVQHVLKVIDYKTGKYTKDKANRLLEGMNTYREFQLPLYLLYAKQAFADYALEAFLVSFRNGDGVKAYGNIGTERGEVEFDDAFEAGLKTAIEAINDSIQDGRFAMTPSEENCAYCEFERICHKSVLAHKEVSDEV
ncbi:MAG TPA: PD-(D/E)XK nuclease family protein, partial [Sulfuricurvum sp.]|nr:PD-(D/E)XK nuclease family protein [Sulfuricurvum sp.]